MIRFLLEFKPKFNSSREKIDNMKIGSFLTFKKLESEKSNWNLRNKDLGAKNKEFKNLNRILKVCIILPTKKYKYIFN